MSNLGCDQRLASVFSEGVTHARQREQSAFDELAGGSTHSLVLYGAGNFGRTILRGLAKNRIDILAFTDADPKLHGQKLEGVTVLSPDEAIQKYGRNALFIVCVWHPDLRSGVQEIVDQLVAKGASHVVPFIYLFWKYPDTFLPHYFWDLPSKYLSRQSDIRQAYELFDEPASKTQFVDDLELRTSGNFRGRPLPCHGRQYFPNDIFRVLPEECFIDCGGYDGDTIQSLVEESDGRFHRIISFEADPENFSRLRSYLAIHPEFQERVAIHQAAVAHSAGTLRFAATAGANAAVSSCGETAVESVALDDILSDESPTMIKMDIEGSELDALKGAARVIASNKPLLAICLYHRPEHLWEIPLHMKSAVPDARLYLRSYSVDGFDTVCYAVPPSRSKKNGNSSGAHHRPA
jgi:FkbM family methyltransferase